MDNRLALDYLLAEQGGICVVVNKTCCTNINNSGQIDGPQNIYEQASWVHHCHQGQMLVLSGPPLKHPPQPYPVTAPPGPSNVSSYSSSLTLPL